MEEGFVVYNGEVYFFVNPSGDYVNNLWKSNGTISGTVEVENLTSVVYIDQPTLLFAGHSHLFFWGQTANGNGTSQTYPYALFRSNGQPNGTVIFNTYGTDPSESELQFPINVANNQTVMAALEGGVIWCTDGTLSGTIEIFNQSSGSYHPYVGGPSGNAAYFYSNSTYWQTDCTVNGTLPVTGNVNLSITDSRLQSSNLQQIGTDLYYLDENVTTNQVVIVRKSLILNTTTLIPFNPGSGSWELHVFNGKLYFAHTDGFGTELWTYDPVSGTMSQHANLGVGSTNSFPEGFISNTNYLFFIDTNNDLYTTGLVDLKIIYE